MSVVTGEDCEFAKQDEAVPGSTNDGGCRQRVLPFYNRYLCHYTFRCVEGGGNHKVDSRGYAVAGAVAAVPYQAVADSPCLIDQVAVYIGYFHRCVAA